MPKSDGRGGSKGQGGVCRALLGSPGEDAACKVLNCVTAGLPLGEAICKSESLSLTIGGK